MLIKIQKACCMGSLKAEGGICGRSHEQNNAHNLPGQRDSGLVSVLR